MKPICIVTAFFDIGRSDFTGYERDNETYFSYFGHWASIKNPMVIYCVPEHRERIMGIRDGYGLKSCTTVIPVEDPFAIESDLYKRMEQAASDEGFLTFRYYDAPENGAPYSYITMLKAWCLAEAAGRIEEDCFLAWVDFGIDHGGRRYADSRDFHFLWEYEFPEKITAFCHEDPSGVSIIDALQFMIPYFDGSAVIVPKALCTRYWEKVRSAMEALVKLGCVDDDQMLSLIVYREEPEMFDIRLEEDWYSVFSLCSHQAFTLSKSSRPEPDQKVLRTMERLAGAPQHPFIRRMYEKVIYYYYGKEEG